MLIFLAAILSISSCSDSERNNNSSDWQKNSKEIQETYLSPRFAGFETADLFLIAQLQAGNEVNIDKLNQFNRIATGDDKIIVFNDTEQFLFSITDETKIDLLVDGIILLTKNNNDVSILFLFFFIILFFLNFYKNFFFFFIFFFLFFYFFFFFFFFFFFSYFLFFFFFFFLKKKKKKKPSKKSLF
jgi:hypothetical protein